MATQRLKQENLVPRSGFPIISRRDLLAGGLGLYLSCSAKILPARSRASDLEASIEEIVRPIIAEFDIPGLAIGLTQNHQRQFFSYGVASRETRQAVTPATLFEIGSISKIYTATLAGFARAARRLDWNDAVSRYVPELEGSNVGRISLLHLGTYTAGGLPLQFPAGVADFAAAVDFLREWRPLHEPGTHRRYSNPSIGLFGHAAAAALGGDFATLIEQDLLRRLGLRETFVRVPHAAAARYAWGYSREDAPVRVNRGVFDAEAYGIKTTASDLLRMVEINIDPSGLEEPLRRALAETRIPRFAVRPMLQGLGWEQYACPVELELLLEGNSNSMIFETRPAALVADSSSAWPDLLYNKTGSTNGFGAYAAFLPSRRLGVVLLANRNFPIPARVGATHAILRAAAGMEA